LSVPPLGEAKLPNDAQRLRIVRINDLEGKVVTKTEEYADTLKGKKTSI
jgi:hypothetical protein